MGKDRQGLEIEKQIAMVEKWCEANKLTPGHHENYSLAVEFTKKGPVITYSDDTPTFSVMELVNG